MPTQSLRRDFGNDLAKMVLDEILFERSQYYYFLGGVQPWSGVGGATADDLPPDGVIDQTEALDRLYRSEIAYVKKISPNDVSLVAKRYDWVANAVYAEWNHTLNMENQNFFVLTDEYNVYKCLNNKGGSLSTVKPTGTSVRPLKTADGYIWKYMYNVPSFKRIRFSSNAYIPVQTSISDSFYNKGAIDYVVVNEEGSGYTFTPLVTINVSNTTTGSGATGTVTIGAGVGAITAVSITSGGTGYTKGVRVKFTSTTGTGATGTAVVNGSGVITGVTITNGGVGYAAGTTVSFVVGGAVLVPIISALTGSIVSVKIIDAGIGYLTAPVVSVVDSASTGTGKYGNATALLSSIVYNGSVQHVNIVDPGIGYTLNYSTTITTQGDGTGALFTPVIYEGRIVDVYVETPGEGYTEIYLTVVGTNTTPAKLSAFVRTSDFTSDQSIIEQTTVEGAIYSIKVTNPGLGYFDASTTSVTITGNGTGATATAVVFNGSITRIDVTNYGSGYTVANVVITNTVPGAIVTTPATAYAILPSLGGHGANAPSELLADTLGISSPLKEEASISTFLEDQEFRNFGIIKNPNNLLTGTRYKSLSGLLVYKMLFTSSTSTLVEDEVLLFNNNKYRVLMINSQEVFLLPLDNDAIAPLGTLTSTLDSDAYSTSETLQILDFDKYSGSLLYISTERPFSFSQEQSIVIKTFIKF